MLLAVPISNYGCTWKVWRALKKLELHSAVSPRATLTNLSFSPNFPRVSISRFTHVKHEQILKLLENSCILKISLSHSQVTFARHQKNFRPAEKFSP